MAVCSSRLVQSFAPHWFVWRVSWRSLATVNSLVPVCQTSTSPRCVTSMSQHVSLYSSQAHNSLSFEDYRKLRKNLKLRSRVAGIPLAFIGMGISSLVNVQMNPRMFEMSPEEVKLIMGLDPIVFAGLCGVASALVGYMFGGTIFTATWRMLSREKARQFDEREAEFLKRLQKHRFSEVSKYDDDYYGDKVLTLSDYRQWVRQQQKRKTDMQKFKESQTSST